jgi:hypothetical protein
MRLSSQSSQFIFNLPISFLKQEVIDSYTPLLEKNWIQYDNVVDYLSSTILSVNFPGISFDLPKQIMPRGKEIYHKPAKNVQDIITTRELTVTFRSVDSDLNYWIMWEILNKHYTDVENTHLHPFTITCLDIHRDALYKIYFKQIIVKSLSENTFNYSQQKVNSKEFTMTFNYNFYDIEFLLNKSKVLETKDLPIIIQKIK